MVLSKYLIGFLMLSVGGVAAYAQPAAPMNSTLAGEDWSVEFQDRTSWWSLRPLMVGPPPDVSDPGWSREPIDRFVRKALDAAELAPSAPAGPDLLLRRLAFVLTGLPPDPSRRERFLLDLKSDPCSAYERLVDELLASPHFGERFARHWMDVVRYTDTYGYESDNPANGSWEYRDYLVRAFNQDVPFDQLVREQLAGDLLTLPRLDRNLGINESMVGPMFYHLGEHREGGSLMFNGIHQQMVDNKIDAFSKAFLATTVACARCHDHKLEAIVQRDYYSLAAVFMTPRWTSRVIDAPGRNDAAIAKLKELRDAIRRELATIWIAHVDTHDAWTMDMLRAKLERKEETATKDAAAPNIEDVAYPLTRLLNASEEVSNIWRELAREWRETRSQRLNANANFHPLTDFHAPQLPDGWIMEGDGIQHGRVDDGVPLIALEADRIVSQLLPRGLYTHALSSRLPGALRSPPQHEVPGQRMSLQLTGGEFAGYLVVQGNGFKSEQIGFLKSTEPIWKSFSDPILKNGVGRVTVEFATTALNPNFPPRIGLAGGLPPTDPGFDKRSWLGITAIVTHETDGTPQDNLDHFVSLYEADAPSSSEEAAARIREWFTATVRRWCEGQLRDGDLRLLNWLLANEMLPNKLRDGTRAAELVNEYRRVELGISYPRTVTGMDERACRKSGYPIDARGDVDQPGELVFPDFLRLFAGRHRVAQTNGSGRLELAESLVENEHPLVTRVYVNRVWQWLFGSGIVTTPDDFGHLGDSPSHPELLDFLAREFMQGGWSTKSLVRRLVLSETFRQSGVTTVAARQRDPANRLLHHYPTRRLEAEAIRDAMLAVSGRLDPALYGRPIWPFRSAEDTTNKRLLSGPLDGRGRRSLYLQLSIMEPPKFLVGFDLPDLKLPAGKRNATNVPGQALTMLNDPLVVELARIWSVRLIEESHASVNDRITAMFVQALGREPTSIELDRWSTALYDLCGEGGARVMSDQTAWRRLAHLFFNAKEFIYYR